MVVLSVAICNRDGAVLVARQFVSMTRLRIEGLLSAFPKLLGSEENESNTKQHTFVETEEVRYLYQPMDALYVLIVTTLSSNIIQDLNTLRLLAKLVPEYCQRHDEEAILENSFELIFAFDEVVSLGYAENVDTNQINTFTKMDSHEEKLANIIKESKINEAKAKAEEAAERLKRINVEKGFEQGVRKHHIEQPEEIIPQTIKPKNDWPMKSKKKTRRRPRGLNPRKGKDIADKNLEEFLQSGTSFKADVAKETPAFDGGTPVQIYLEEKLSIKCDESGQIKKFDITGALIPVINDPDCARLKIKVSGVQNMKQTRLPSEFNKSTWMKEMTICMKDETQPYDMGLNVRPKVVQWRQKFKEQSDLPLEVNFWIIEENDVSEVSCELSCQVGEGKELNDVSLIIPGVHGKPQIENASGEHSYDRRESKFTWFAANVLPDGESCKLDIKVPEAETEEFYPVEVSFNINSLYSNIEIESVQTVDGEDVEFTVEKECIVKSYTIQEF